MEIYIEKINDSQNKIKFERINTHSITQRLTIRSHLGLTKSMIQAFLMIFYNINYLYYECAMDIDGEGEDSNWQIKLPYLKDFVSNFS